ncbi:glutaminyl-tRNA synthetase [Sporobacter termitidis DSM 10068]|uniref:Glutamine--tRNA ligase n=1 Tax=Sporobacter termitidis DSM 10068 TaxID=1123282 RepID=A0A1M5VKF3_9FIRM|nr:glutamine--tRNA ligase/YqeY domain fusion protein [Sporobacter termitidis]SHH75658.1 glutaminyl-tRNA synthetase [Sporobacter termitidis DSM 10068]
MEETKNFIHAFIEEDLAPGGRFEGKTVHTRFPPEPNGYLHIGHCKALTIDFGSAERFGGLCNLRMDDTNPAKEDEEFVDAIQEDIRWLGFTWGDRFYYGSDYFEKTYELAVGLIKKGLAYVCQLSPEEFKERRGDVGVPATSPYRDRPVEESLDLFQRMRSGEFKEGEMTLRAKIDLASGNFNMRDPVLYRIRYAHHHRQGDKWCIYPMYDFAHPIQDALEGITHSLCSLEYEDHRPLYDWVIENTDVPSNPRQIEFARLGINYTVMSKRKLRRLVEEGYVSGWDDPRMPTLCGLRRRGYTPAAVRNFCDRIGVAKVSSTVEYGFLEHCLREDLNLTARRAMAVLRPVKLTITNYPAGQSEEFEIENNPEDEAAGTRRITFSKHLWIEQDDFMAEPPKKYNRLFVGNEVRLKSAYIVKCTGYTTDDSGAVTEVLAEYDPLTRGGNTPDGRKVRGTIHWVDAANALDAEVRIYDNLFSDPDPDGGDKDFITCLNPNSLETLTGCKAERSLESAKSPDTFQFLRLGYFTADSRDSKPGQLVFNRSVPLKDSFKP